MTHTINNPTDIPEPPLDEPDDREPSGRDDDPPEPWPDPELADREADRYDEHLDRQAELRELVLWRAP